MYDKLVLDRSPGIIRAPFDVPSTDAEWAATSWLPKSTPYDVDQYRPPVADGAPGPECPPELKGGEPDGTARVGHKLKVDHGTDNDTWSRYDKQTDVVSYLWLRDGAPLPLYNGAPIGSKPECECDGMSFREYEIQPEDSGHWLSVQVTVVNEEDSATSVVTNAILVRGNQTDAQVERDLMALQDQIAAMGLDKGTTDELVGKIKEIIHRVMDGESPCDRLDDLEDKIAKKAGEKTPKISASQQAALNSAIDHIKAEYPC
jgi:hypothetical protein